MDVRGPPTGVPVAAFFSLFSVICALFSFAMGPIALVCCCLVAGAVALCLGESVGKSHAALLPVLALIGALTYVFAVCVGALNWRANYHLYRTAESGRAYSGVSAEEKALPHSDAGTVTFSGATLNTMNSLGLSDGDHMYCVAPIMTRHQSAGEGEDKQVPVQFWAVGMDCCGRHQNFECDDADLLNANGGIVVPQPRPESWLGLFSGIVGSASRWDRYVEAVEAASEYHGLKAAQPPVLLHWVERPEDVKQDWHVASVLVFVFSSMIYLAFLLAAWMLISYYHTKRLRTALDDELARDDPRPTGAANFAASMRVPSSSGGAGTSPCPTRCEAQTK